MRVWEDISGDSPSKISGGFDRTLCILIVTLLLAIKENTHFPYYIKGKTDYTKPCVAFYHHGYINTDFVWKVLIWRVVISAKLMEFNLKN